MCRKKFKLILSYDGTDFYGWQETAAGPSIQGTLKAAAQRLGSGVEVEAASRTDRGVHAHGQTAHLLIDKDFDPRKLSQALNAHLPHPIRIRAAEAATTDFHATLCAIKKTYCYFVCNTGQQLPIHRLYSWHVPRPLDLEAMEAASGDFVGRKDFSAFSSGQTDDPFRTLHKALVSPLEGGRLRIELQGDRFLYKMARTIAGTLVGIGSGKLPRDAVPRLFTARDRTLAGATAPAHGLFLWHVDYV